MANAIMIGNEQHAPELDEIVEPLRAMKNNVIANLLGLPLAKRPRCWRRCWRASGRRARAGAAHTSSWSTKRITCCLKARWIGRRRCCTCPKACC